MNSRNAVEGDSEEALLRKSAFYSPGGWQGVAGKGAKRGKRVIEGADNYAWGQNERSG